MTARQQANVLTVLTAQQQACRIIMIRQLGNTRLARWRGGPKVVRAFVSCNREEPRRERPPGIELGYGSKCSQKSILRDLPGVRFVATSIGHEAINSPLKPMHKLFKSIERSRLALCRQSFIGDRFVLGGHLKLLALGFLGFA